MSKKVDKKLDNVINLINKDFGENAVIKGSELDNKPIERIPTGSVALDFSLGGGIPIGRYIQLEGKESSTKTTQCLHIIRNAQKMGLICAIFDIEGTTDRAYMTHLGIDVDKLLYLQPEGLEQCGNLLDSLQEEGTVDLVLLDSLAALTSLKEYETEMGDSIQLGIVPRLLGMLFRKYQARNNGRSRRGERPLTLIATNQLRENIGKLYGDPEYAPGGNAKDFWSSITIRLRKGQNLEQGTGKNKRIVGHEVRYRVSKNKTYAPMRSGEFHFYNDENDLGIKAGFNDNFSTIVEKSIEMGLIRRAGAWYYLEEEKFQGMKDLLDFLRNDEKYVEKLTKEIMKEVKDL